MSLCAYCNHELGAKNHKRTDEHIIPASLLKMFPEQDISISPYKRFVDNRGMTISDVCETCNNVILSQLDSYGKEIIEKYFSIPYAFSDYNTPFAVELDANLFIRWIIKIIYNTLRSTKSPTEYIERNIPYILGHQDEIPPNISILMGSHINLNPVPEELWGYIPLQINPNPILEYNSYIRQKCGEPSKRLLLKGCRQSFSLRLSTCILFVIFWKDSVADKIKNEMISTLKDDFRFTLLIPTLSHYTIRCVSSPSNAFLSNYSHFFSEIAVQEMIASIKDSIQGRDIGDAYNDFTHSWTPEMTKIGRAFVEAAEFPNNKKKQQQLNDILSQMNP